MAHNDLAQQVHDHLRDNPHLFQPARPLTGSIEILLAHQTIPPNTQLSVEALTAHLAGYDIDTTFIQYTKCAIARRHGEEAPCSRIAARNLRISTEESRYLFSPDLALTEALHTLCGLTRHSSAIGTA